MGRLGSRYWLAWSGSLRVTLWLLGLLALVVALFVWLPFISSSWLAIPLVLLALNLLSAILTNPRFRHQLPLLSFHLALLALLLLIAAGRLSYLKGHVEVTVGESFTGQLTEFKAGPLYQDGLQEVGFFLESFTIDYDPGIQRGATRSQVRWQDEQGEIQTATIGDHRPLIVAGYRFYTSHNKGFAPIFSWQSDGGAAQTGSIHLPAYPAHEFKQALEWELPGVQQKIWTQLQFDEVILDPLQPSRFRPPINHNLILRFDGKRYQLQAGDGIELPGGRLVYKGLRTWMGFSVSYDWTLPWLFAAGLFAVMSMGWHYWRKYNRQPWQDS